MNHQLIEAGIRLAMNEAYWQAVRAMCDRCAEGVPVVAETYPDGKTELFHRVHHSKVGDYEANCRAAPIHALIEKLNEVTE